MHSHDGGVRFGADVGIVATDFRDPAKIEGRSKSGPRHDVKKGGEGLDVLVRDGFGLTHEGV